MAVKNQTKCPLCGRIKKVVQRRDGTFWCNHCNVQFDDQEDGDIGYGSPESNAIRNEERRRCGK